jgi:hypothetical protein
VGYTRNMVVLPGGAFTADIASARLSYAFSTRLFMDALVQHNSLDNQVSANVRLNLIHRPGSDLYLVLNERRGGEVELWEPRERGVVAKVTYLIRM